MKPARPLPCIRLFPRSLLLLLLAVGGLLAAWPCLLPAAGIAPDLAKLHAVPVFASAREAARTNRIPVDGFDAVQPTNTLSPGDSITALVTLSEKRKQKSQWLLYVEAVEPTAIEKARPLPSPKVLYAGAGDKLTFTGSAAPVTLRLLGPFAEGTGNAAKVQDQKIRITLNPGFLSIGLDEAAAAFCRLREKKLHGQFLIRPKPFTEVEMAQGKQQIAALQLSTNEQRAIAGSQLALMSYVHLVQQTPGLDSLFYKVVKLPSVWSMVRTLGVNATIQLEKDYVGAASVTDWTLPAATSCYTFPLSLHINEQPALMTTLVVAPPRPPFLECGGIVGFLAEKPGEPNTYILLRILSARHGKSAAVVY